MFEEQFAELPVQPPRRTETLPGLRLMGAIPKFALILPLMFMGFFTIMPLAIMSSDPTMRLAYSATQSSRGHVLMTTAGSNCRGATSHRVVYTFAPPSGGEFRGTATLCEESPYYAVQQGDTVDVQFLPGDPAVNALRGDRRNDAPPILFFFMMPLFVLAMFTPMFWPQIREILRARRLFKHGQLAVGTVVFVKKRVAASWPGWSSNSAAEVFIAFQSSRHEPREGIAWCPNEWLINQLVPGAKVHVAFMGDTSNRVALLDAFWR